MNQTKGSSLKNLRGTCNLIPSILTIGIPSTRAHYSKIRYYPYPLLFIFFFSLFLEEVLVFHVPFFNQRKVRVPKTKQILLSLSFFVLDKQFSLSFLLSLPLSLFFPSHSHSHYLPIPLLSPSCPYLFIYLFFRVLEQYYHITRGV